jgi:Mn2+/Fe2+ NRAMP family transporter
MSVARPHADLPAKPPGFWRLAGPGAVLVGLSIGAGELIIWPRTTAAFGGSMTWAALLGIALQFGINCELGRYTLATGESAYRGFARLSRHWAPVFILLNVLGWLLPGWARACGGALKALVVGPDGWGAPWTWTAITFAGVAAVLFGPRMVSRSVERTTEALVVVMTLGLVTIAILIGETGTWGTLAAGAVNVPYRDPGMPPYELFSAIVFAGAGGTANLFLCLYIRDKGWGMAAAGRADAPLPLATPANRARWRAWFRHLVLDQALFFWGLNSLTILLFVYAALAVLHPAGVVPDQEMLVWDEAAMLGTVAGELGRRLFLVVGVACLFSTQLTLVDGVARSLADIVHGTWGWTRRRSPEWWYLRFAALWIVLGVALTYLYERLPPILFLLSAGFFGGIAMAIYVPLTLVMNRRLLPEVCRPGPLATGALALISVFYGAFAVWAIVRLVASLA